MDIAKAFDRMCHGALLAKFPSYGLPHNHSVLQSHFVPLRHKWLQIYFDNSHYCDFQVVEIPVITDAVEEETSPEVESSRSASFSRAGDSIEGDSRKVSLLSC